MMVLLNIQRILVDVLKKYKVGGTFFYIGTRVKKYPEYVDYAKKMDFPLVAIP